MIARNTSNFGILRFSRHLRSPAYLRMMLCPYALTFIMAMHPHARLL